MWALLSAWRSAMSMAAGMDFRRVPARIHRSKAIGDTAVYCELAQHHVKGIKLRRLPAWTCISKVTADTAMHRVLAQRHVNGSRQGFWVRVHARINRSKVTEAT
eukprot:1139583-Pelagomonas_calceolata.AAC.1